MRLVLVSFVLWNIVIPLLVTFIFAEYLIYYVKLGFHCSWPLFNASDKMSTHGDTAAQLHLLILSDTHLLGNRRGHPLDKLRREWQMYQAFQTAMNLYKPQMVVHLGDVLDEGLIASRQEFEQYSNRFQELFHVDPEVSRVVAVGNHDIGFHDRVLAYEPFMRKRFEKNFNSSLVSNFSISGLDFVVINSMALEGDGCNFCTSAMSKIRTLGQEIKRRCSGKHDCNRPIVLMHFPLFRVNDGDCNEEDSVSQEERFKKFRERIDCVSRDSTKFLFEHLRPQFVFSGHTHNGCIKTHETSYGNVTEWTVASFSHRNRLNPSFLLVTIVLPSKNNSSSRILISKCFLPQERTLVMIYILGILVTAILCYRQLKKQRRQKLMNLNGKNE